MSWLVLDVLGTGCGGVKGLGFAINLSLPASGLLCSLTFGGDISQPKSSFFAVEVLFY